MDAKNKEPSFQDIAKFLLGEGELDGLSFGDDHPVFMGKNWWRAYLRSAIAQPALVETVGAFRHKDTGEIKYVLNSMEHNENDWEDVYIGSQPPTDTMAVPVAEYGAMKLDAERYRFVRGGKLSQGGLYTLVKLTGQEFDNTIDAAAKSVMEDV